MIQAKTLFKNWYQKRSWQPFDYQEECFEAYDQGYSGLLNAPTGSGKTFSLFLPILSQLAADYFSGNKECLNGLKILWISPVRALASDLKIAMKGAADDMGIPFKVDIRTGDTSSNERQKQKTKPPQCLITTPESLQILLAAKGYSELLGNLEAIVVDEWHELLGSKRGVLLELGLNRVKSLNPKMRIWGISATIGNLNEALDVLLGSYSEKGKIIRSKLEKDIVVKSLFPEELEHLPWGGHLGINMLHKVIPIIEAGKSTLLFTNTRSQTEIWYQKILEANPEWAGVMALHHGSLAQETRTWVEESLRDGYLKLVVCTSALDLGVDFRPVDTIIQVGGPKGVARFLQRAGRSGHSPGALSSIYFVPAHSLELIEAAALRCAIFSQQVESKLPLTLSWDVLIQYLVTLSVSEGFKPEEIFKELKLTHAYKNIESKDFERILDFLVQGGDTLRQYPDFHKVVPEEDGLWRVKNRRIAYRHRLSIGTILSDASIAVKYLSGGYLGSVEEYFIAQLKIGDVFSFAGRNLEFVSLKDMNCLVRLSKKKKAQVVSWMGARMQLSGQLSKMVRQMLNAYVNQDPDLQPEMVFISPLLDRQNRLSHLPAENEFLIEQLRTKEGYHLFFHTFEGRNVNEGMAALIAYRIGQSSPITFSIAVTDYGFELLSDQEVDIAYFLSIDVLGLSNLEQDINQGMNTLQLASRKFREVAQIAGLLFTGMPGKSKKTRHLQASAKMFFDTFSEYEPENLLLKQSVSEVMSDQLELSRLKDSLKRIANQKLILKKPIELTPFCFPIMVERIRSKVTTESIEERVARLIEESEKPIHKEIETTLLPGRKTSGNKPKKRV